MVRITSYLKRNYDEGGKVSTSLVVESVPKMVVPYRDSGRPQQNNKRLRWLEDYEIEFDVAYSYYFIIFPVLRDFNWCELCCFALKPNA